MKSPEYDYIHIRYSMFKNSIRKIRHDDKYRYTEEKRNSLIDQILRNNKKVSIHAIRPSMGESYIVITINK